jgi:hypothetical protein
MNNGERTGMARAEEPMMARPKLTDFRVSRETGPLFRGCLIFVHLSS